MKQARMFIVAIFLIIIVLAPTILVLNSTSAKNARNQPFYVGVTYCGSSVQEAKDLIDKVKDYTNFFVLLSGSLQYDRVAMEEIGDYVVASDLTYAVGGSTTSGVWLNNWLIGAKERWGEQFIGIYYSDEPGGDMLDKELILEDTITVDENGNKQGAFPKIKKSDNGEIMLFEFSGNERIEYVYHRNGKIDINTEHYNSGSLESVNYWPNGSITASTRKIVAEYNESVFIYNFYTPENITKYPSAIQPYKQILKQNPIQTYDDAAQVYVNRVKETFNPNLGHGLGLDKKQLDKEAILVFTADYGLYWWDYQSGYDMVLAELAWNHSVAQHIGLVRGAANLQGKSWGTCITWKYTQSPFLTDGEEMFEQMKASYETGAEYVLIFNYSEDPANPNTLQEEHFRALERFWKDVVQNPDVTHGGVKAEAVLVLPKNYGWGMRRSDHIEEDFIWGIWPEDDKTPEIWSQLESRIDQYGLKLDIVFEDSNYPVTGKYDHIYYCGFSQTIFSSLTEFFTSFYVRIIGCILLFFGAAGVVLIRFRHHKKQHN